MSDLVWGDVDWNSADTGEAGGRRTEFMKLVEGANCVRIMGNPSQFYVNWLTLPDGKKRKVNTPEDETLVQKLDDAGFKRQTRWLLKVLDRKDNQFKLLEVGRQIFSGVQELYNNPKWGKVTAYDITITRGPKGKQPLYSVQPDPKEALDSSLKQSFMEFNDGLNLERLLSPSEPAYVCELLGWPAPSSSGSSEDMGDDPFAASEGESEGGELDFEFE